MSAGQSFESELHDAGKLVNHAAGIVRFVTEDGVIRPTRGGHVFEDVAWDFHGLDEPETESWLGIRYHHHPALREKRLPFAEVRAAFRELDEGAPLAPDDEARRFKRLVLLSLADSVAASQSRVLEPGRVPKGEMTPVRVKLWNRAFHEEYGSDWSPVVDDASWQRFVMALASHSMSGRMFLEAYEQNLRLRSEDASAPRNLTSLYTHIRLVGQIYRILDRFVSLEADYQLRYGEQVAKSQNEALSNWLFRLVQAEIEVLQVPVRAKDLHVFTLVPDGLASLRSDPALKDYVLYSVGQTVFFLLPDGAESPRLEDVLARQLETFAVHSRTYRLPLDEVTPDQSGLRQRLRGARAISRKEMRASKGEGKQYWNAVDSQIVQKLRALDELQAEYSALYPGEIGADGGKAIEPDLCEICQLRHSPTENQYETSYGGVEYLCKECAAIRNDANVQRLRTIAAWEEEVEGEAGKVSGRLAWVRITLDAGVLLAGIQARFGEYLEELDVATARQERAVEIAKANFRPTAIVADFIDDYVEMLAELERWVQSRYGKGEDEVEDWQLISRQEAATGAAGADFFVLRMTAGQELYDFLQAYHELLKKRFPEMLEPCPIRIAINVAPAKHPFYEHWRDLKQAGDEVWLHVPGRRLVHFAVRYLENFLALTNEAMEGRSGYLHNLAGLEARAGGSPILANLAFDHDMKNRRRRHRVPAELRKFAKLVEDDAAIQMSQLLGWYRLINWGKQG